jgi:hypothetical protein
VTTYNRAGLNALARLVVAFAAKKKKARAYATSWELQVMPGDLSRLRVRFVCAGRSFTRFVSL